MDWDKLRVFHAVAEAGSFTHAGEKLNLSQSAVSRQISALEESLGVTLFHRHARGLILTEQGETLYGTARDVFTRLAAVENQLLEAKEVARGPLKVTATVAFGSTWLTPRLSEFHAANPEVDLTLVLDDGELDLGMREADIAIRFTPPRQVDLIQRHLMSVGFNVYAHKSYIEKRGMPVSVDDLDSHTLIAYAPDVRPPVRNINWLLDAGNAPPGGRQPSLKINNLYAILRAVESGFGLASLPDYMINGRRDLVRVLPGHEGPKADVYFVYAEELRQSKRVAVFRDFLVKKVAEADF